MGRHMDDTLWLRTGMALRNIRRTHILGSLVLKAGLACRNRIYSVSSQGKEAQRINSLCS